MYIVSMSPTIDKIGNAKLMIYTDDHGRPHVHVVAPDAEAKIEIHSLIVIRSHGFNQKTLNRFKKYIAENREELLEAWNEIHE